MRDPNATLMPKCIDDSYIEQFGFHVAGLFLRACSLHQDKVPITKKMLIKSFCHKRKFEGAFCKLVELGTLKHLGSGKYNLCISDLSEEEAVNWYSDGSRWDGR